MKSILLLLSLLGRVDGNCLFFSCLVIVVSLLSSLCEVILITCVPLFISLSFRDAPDGYNGMFSALLPHISSTPVIALLAFFCLVIILAGIVRTLSLYLTEYAAMQIGSYLADNVYLRVFGQPYRYYRDSDKSNILNSLTINLDLTVFSLSNLFVAITAFFVCAAISITMLASDTMVTGALIVFLGLIYFTINKVTTSRLNSISSQTALAIDNQIINLLDTYENIKHIILESSLSNWRNRFLRIDRRIRYLNFQAGILISLPRYLVESLTILCLIVFIYFLSLPSNSGNILPTLSFVVISLQRLVSNLQTIFRSYGVIKSKSAQVAQVLSYLSLPYAPSSGQPEPYNVESITLHEIYYSHKDRSGAMLISNLSFTVRSGRLVAISGPSGCGKSTVIDIIMCMLMPYSGNVYVNNIAIESPEDVREYQQQISYVSQNSHFLNSSILENIIQFDAFDSDRLKKVLDICQLHAVVSSFDEGLDYVIGENGSGLSGGQLQRIAIARALYKDKSVLILDESTSALDKQTELDLMLQIKSNYKDRIVIIISHNPSLLSLCDHVIELG